MANDEQNDPRDFDLKLLHDITEFHNSEVIAALQQGNLHKASDSYGATLLHFATVDGNNEIVKHLLEMGANVNAQDCYGVTPLMLVLKKGCLWTMKCLIEAGADIHIADSNGGSIFKHILHSNEVDWDVVRLFFKVVKRQCTSVDEVVNVLTRAKCPLYHAIHWGSTRITRSIYDIDKDVDCCDPKSEKTALHVAVRLSDLPNVRLLLDLGADINAYDEVDRTPLSHFNSKDDSAENLEILRLLIARGASLYRCDWKDRLQVYYIMKFGVRNVVKTLLEHRVNLSRQDDNGYTLVHYLAENANCVIDVIQGMRFKPNKTDDIQCTPLHLAASAGIASNINFLLDNGADIDRPNKNHFTPLFYAVMSTSSTIAEMDTKKECIELLLQRGADAQYDGNGVETVFDIIIWFSNYTLSKPILLHLAAQELLGTPIKQSILKKINSRKYFARHLQLYRRQLAAMQRTTIRDSVTLFKFVVESDKIIARYARNRDVVERLMRLRTKSSVGYCKQFLRRRVEKAIRMAQSKRRAAIAVDNVIKIGQGSYIDVVDRIAEYLNDLDVNNLLRALKM